MLHVCWKQLPFTAASRKAPVLGQAAAQSFHLTQHYLTFAAVLELNAVLLLQHIPHPQADQAMSINSMLTNAKRKKEEEDVAMTV